MDKYIATYTVTLNVTIQVAAANDEAAAIAANKVYAELDFNETKTEWENQGGWRIIDDALRLMLGYYDTLH